MKKKARNPEFFISHILESITLIENYIKGIKYEKFKKDTKTSDAVVRNLEIIGEATKNIPTSLKNNHLKIPWGKNGWYARCYCS